MTGMNMTYAERMDKIQEIRNRLRDFRLSQMWLLQQLGNRGVETDKFELSSVLAGSRAGANGEKIITLSLEILNYYEERMVLDDSRREQRSAEDLISRTRSGRTSSAARTVCGFRRGTERSTGPCMCGKGEQYEVRFQIPHGDLIHLHSRLCRCGRGRQYLASRRSRSERDLYRLYVPVRFSRSCF